jgi:hypothetical protein
MGRRPDDHACADQRPGGRSRGFEVKNSKSFVRSSKLIG